MKVAGVALNDLQVRAVTSTVLTDVTDGQLMTITRHAELPWQPTSYKVAQSVSQPVISQHRDRWKS